MSQDKRQKRTALLQLVSEYLDAVVYDDISCLPIAPNVRATYNGIEVPAGENEIWKEVLRFPARQTFVDPENMSACFFGTATNDCLLDEMRYFYPKPQGKWANCREYNRSEMKWWYYFLRLQVVDGQITEIEEVTILWGINNFWTQAKEYPPKNLQFDIPLPDDDVRTRREMIEIVETYWDALERRIEWKDCKCHPDCQRYEFNVQCTNSKRDYHSLRTSFLNPKFTWGIADRRYPVIDEKLGVAVAVVQFEQRLEDSSPGFIAVEAFKVIDGMFREIMVYLKPMSLTTGWKGVDRYTFDD